jgi:catechol 2,3-dioxygenase-like lactoylglutathione lyase family enzyme
VIFYIAPMSNLENFRKQAKQYLRWHRERYYPVAAIIREHLTRFRLLSDPEILTAAFRLADAQELVARKEGFERWQALRTGASTAMSQTHPHSQPTLTSVAAHLYVRDLKASTDFFTTKLGFSIDFVYGDPPFYGQVSRDNARLALRWMDESFFAEDIRQRAGLLSASITLASADEIKQLFLTCQAADVPIAQSLRNEPWQAKTFIVKDPDGNLILFAAPAN